MVALIMLAISVVTLGQFALYYWRAILAGVAAQPLSDRVKEIAGVNELSIGAGNFYALLRLHNVAPALGDTHGRLWGVNSYFLMIESLNRLLGAQLPSLAAWTDRELAACSKYVAVMLDDRLTRNLACAAEIRSC